MKSLINIIPAVLVIPFWILNLLYFVFLPETLYYALGIYFDIWFPILQSFWGYIILFILFLIPFINIALVLLLIFQSFAVVFIFLFGSYEPSVHGYITMYPAIFGMVVFAISRFADR